MANILRVRAAGRRPADFTTDARVLRLSGMALVVGVTGAGVAWALVRLIGLFTNLAFYGRWSTALVPPSAIRVGPWIVVIPVIGGLVVGAMARFGSEKIRGHGIPEALEAIIIGESRIQGRVAVLKPLSSAISIGTGGPFGAEGPIIMTGGAFGSLFAQCFHLSTPERKTLLVAGAAAGMSAIFASPVAAVLLAVELLLFEWKPRSFVPVAVASATAAATRPFLLGAGPLFPMRPSAPLPVVGLIASAAVGVVAGLAAVAVTFMVYGCEDAFGKLRLHWMWWPAIGGLAVGVGGLIDARALGVGYGMIAALLSVRLAVDTLVTLLVVKAVIWSIALGSGTSGGVLAPLLVMGGALGALEAHLIPVGDPNLWALLGMAAMMAGAMRIPFTAMVFAVELTHDVTALLPLLVACAAAHLVTVLILPRSILTEKVARKGHHLVREYAVDPLDLLRVGDVMRAPARVLPASMTVHEAMALLRQAYGDESSSIADGASLVVSDEGAILGVVGRRDAVGWAEARLPPGYSLADVAMESVSVGSSHESLLQIAHRMMQAGAHWGVANDPTASQRFGIISLTDILEARLETVRDETKRRRMLFAGGAARRRDGWEN